MTTSPAPGSWTVEIVPMKDKNSSRTHAYVVRGPRSSITGGRMAIATVGNELHDYPAEDALATMIAALPDVIEALVEALAEMETIDGNLAEGRETYVSASRMQLARDVLVKALGVSS